MEPSTLKLDPLQELLMWCDQIVCCRAAQTPDWDGMYAMVGELDAHQAIFETWSEFLGRTLQELVR
jgi:hypothetical protein